MVHDAVVELDGEASTIMRHPRHRNAGAHGDALRGENLPQNLALQDFQDPSYTLNVRQLMKCCVEEITPDGRLIPFCAYNSVGYREQVRSAMTGVPVPDVVPNATPLQPILGRSPHGSKLADPGRSDAVAPDTTNIGRKAVRR